MNGRSRTCAFGLITAMARNEMNCNEYNVYALGTALLFLIYSITACYYCICPVKKIYGDR